MESQNPKRRKISLRRRKLAVASDLCKISEKFLHQFGILEDKELLDMVIMSDNVGVFQNTQEILLALRKSKGSADRMFCFLKEKSRNKPNFGENVKEIFFSIFEKDDLLRISFRRPYYRYLTSSFTDSNWMLEELCEFVCTGAWDKEYLQRLYNPQFFKKQREVEKDVLSKIESAIKEDISFFRLCEIVVPLDIIVHIISFIERGSELLNLACVSENFLYLVFWNWGRLIIRNESLQNISLVALKGARELIFENDLKNENLKYLIENIERDRILFIKFSSLEYPFQQDFPNCQRLCFPLGGNLLGIGTNVIHPLTFPKLRILENLCPSMYKHFMNSVVSLREISVCTKRLMFIFEEISNEFWTLFNNIEVLGLRFCMDDELKRLSSSQKIFSKLGNECRNVKELKIMFEKNANIFFHPDEKIILTFSEDTIFPSVTQLKVDASNRSGMPVVMNVMGMFHFSSRKKLFLEKIEFVFPRIFYINGKMKVHEIFSPNIQAKLVHFYSEGIYASGYVDELSFSFEIEDMIQSICKTQFERWVFELDVEQPKKKVHLSWWRNENNYFLCPFLLIEKCGKGDQWIIKCDLEGLKAKELNLVFQNLLKVLSVKKLGVKRVRIFALFDLVKLLTRHCVDANITRLPNDQKCRYPYVYVVKFCGM